MPFFIPFLVVGLGVVALVGGACADAEDQRTKRQADQARFQAHLQNLQARIAQLEAHHATLIWQLGEKNQQVRALAAEILRLRAELAQYTSIAA